MSTTPTTPTIFDPNSVADFAVKNKLVDKWTPQNAAKLYETQGLGTSKDYLATGGKNSAMNMALLSKLKGYKGTTDPKSISGSSSVQMNKSKSDAMNKAGNTVAPEQKTDTTTPTPTPTPTPSTTTNENPTIVGFDTAGKAAIETATTQVNQQIDSLTAEHATQISQMQRQKAAALASADAEYTRANPYGSGSDKQEFLSSISKNYDDSIKQAQASYDDQKRQLQFGLTSQVQSINADVQKNKVDYQNKLTSDFKDYLTGLKSGDGTTPAPAELMDAINTAMQAGKTFEQAKSEIVGAIEYAKRVAAKEARAETALNLSIRASARASEMLGISLNREQRQERAQAVSAMNTAADNFTKAGTPGQQLNNAASWMSSIAAVEDGKSVSALGIIDALVRLDSGQAIRQGQTNLIEKSGTYSDSLNKFFAKFSKSKIGANTVLSPNQVAQIKAQAEKITKEKIKAGISNYAGMKAAVAENIDLAPDYFNTINAVANISDIETLISRYGDPEDKAKAGIPTTETKQTTTPSSGVPDGYYQASDGKYYKK